jgi:hypothetical protein
LAATRLHNDHQATVLKLPTVNLAAMAASAMPAFADDLAASHHATGIAQAIGHTMTRTMRSWLALLLSVPALAAAQCSEFDSKRFFSEHAPAAGCRNPAGDTCLDLPRIVDDRLHALVLNASADYLATWMPAAQAVRGKPDQAPPGTMRIVDNALRMDLTRRSVFVTCDGEQAYFFETGGLAGKAEWRGPVALRTLAQPR